jgi:hypothetical protein
MKRAEAALHPVRLRNRSVAYCGPPVAPDRVPIPGTMTARVARNGLPAGKETVGEVIVAAVPIQVVELTQRSPLVRVSSPSCARSRSLTPYGLCHMANP